jgi:hypothetical protein
MHSVMLHMTHKYVLASNDLYYNKYINLFICVCVLLEYYIRKTVFPAGTQYRVHLMITKSLMMVLTSVLYVVHYIRIVFPSFLR